MDVIEHNLRLWVERHARYERVAYAAAEAVKGTDHTSAAALIMSHATNLAARIVGLTESFIRLVNADEVYGAPPVVRSLHETCCVPCYMARELIPRLCKGTPKSVNHHHRLLYRLGLGTGPGVGYGSVRAIPVDALNRAAAAWVIGYIQANGARADEATEKAISMIYGPLSDRTHPNFNATAPGVKYTDEGLRVHLLRPHFDQGTIDQLLSATFFMLIAAGEAMDEVVSAAEGHPTPFPPGEPEWESGDLMSPEEAAVLLPK
jgi:hypothetical protein